MRAPLLTIMMALGIVAVAIHLASSPARAETRTAIFAGGCFWCVEADFDKVPGVISTTSGYIGGKADNPTYRNHKGFREAVAITFNDSRVSYDTLLDIFWRTIDPTDGGGQFCDRGPSYTTAIYAVGDAQIKAARRSKKEAERALGRAIVTPVVSAPKFWPAEDYHQNYYKKNPARYNYYRRACGRDRKVESLWGEAAYRGVPGH